MIGNLNKKIFFLILLIPLLFSCGNVETDNEIGRYQVIEKNIIVVQVMILIGTHIIF
jgi:membrane-anchored protein YejM (alkaline phosphatase superfamily)